MNYAAKTIISLTIAIVFNSTGYCNDQINLPRVITNAIDTYEARGAGEFMSALLKGSQLEKDKKALSGGVISQIESFYGDYHGFEASRAVKISESTSIYYYLLKYERGPLFCMSTVYKYNNNEIVIRFNFHTNESKVFPQSVL